MYSRTSLIARYLRYYIRASNSRGHGMHSPFVYTFIREVLNDKHVYPEYLKLEDQRALLSKDQKVLHVEDLGAGSATMKSRERKVRDIANHSLKSRKYAALLFRIARFIKADSIIELGTSLGLTTSYLALARPGANVFTFEGSSDIAACARNLFNRLQLTNIRQINGNFDDTLTRALANIGAADMVFIDGNHRYAPTMNYYRQLLEVCDERSVIILDDIHWSSEMEQAWDECKRHPAVTLSIDLFYIGLLFYSKDFRVPQHFCIRY